jgi:hypothetical protein
VPALEVKVKLGLGLLVGLVGVVASATVGATDVTVTDPVEVPLFPAGSVPVTLKV